MLNCRDWQKGWTYLSKSSNSSILRWRERNAAARFLTRRASRLESPDTSGWKSSLLASLDPESCFSRVEALLLGQKPFVIAISRAFFCSSSATRLDKENG